MGEDVLVRLRRADPCPQPPTYAEATVVGRIRAITGAAELGTQAPTFDLTETNPRPRGVQHRIVLVAAVVVVLVIGAAVIAIALRGQSRSNPAAPAPTPGADWNTFSGNGVMFRYPPAWRSYPYRWSSSFTNSLTYLSTSPVPNPCRTTHPGGNTHISCGPPAAHLGRTGVLITWTQSGFPHLAPPLDQHPSTPGHPIRVARHPARLYSGPAGSECGTTGAVTAIRATIASGPSSGDQLQMIACLGPDNQTANSRAVMAMLDTLVITR